MLLYLEELSANPLTRDSGPTKGGTMITIKGTGFAPGAIVYIGDLEALAIDVISTEDIIAFTPQVNSPGIVDVVVENPDGTTVFVDQFIYEIPPTGTITLPQNIGNDEDIKDLQIVNNILYLLTDKGLRTYNFVTTVVVPIGHIALDNECYDLEIRNGLAFISDEKGLTIIDISDLSYMYVVDETHPAPIALAQNTSFKGGRGIDVSGTTAYLTVYNDGIDLIEVDLSISALNDTTHFSVAILSGQLMLR